MSLDPPRTRTFVCDCIGSCTVLLVTEWEKYGDQNYEAFWEFYEHVPSYKGLKDRIKVAWKVLRKKDPYMAGVILYDQQVKELRDFLNETIGDKEE